MTAQTSPLDLGTLKISKLLAQYAIPAIIAMTASSLYNMVDSEPWSASELPHLFPSSSDRKTMPQPN